MLKPKINKIINYLITGLTGLITNWIENGLITYFVVLGHNF